MIIASTSFAGFSRNGEVTAADSLINGWSGSIPFLELTTPIRGPGTRPGNPGQAIFRPVTFCMSWSRRIAATCPLIPCVIAYLPVQAVFTLHVFLLNGIAVMDSKAI
jgi:hypothetical protein